MCTKIQYYSNTNTSKNRLDVTKLRVLKIKQNYIIGQTSPKVPLPVEASKTPCNTCRWTHPTQTASRSVQPFSHSSRKRVPKLYSVRWNAWLKNLSAAINAMKEINSLTDQFPIKRQNNVTKISVYHSFMENEGFHSQILIRRWVIFQTVSIWMKFINSPRGDGPTEQCAKQHLFSLSDVVGLDWLPECFSFISIRTRRLPVDVSIYFSPENVVLLQLAVTPTTSR